MIKTKTDIFTCVVDTISNEIENAVKLSNSEPHETEMLIHEYRKIIKRIRAIIRLIRSSLKEETFYTLDSQLSQIAKSVEEARDSAVNLQSLLKLDSISKENLPEEIKNKAIAELSKQYKLSYLDSQGGLSSKLKNVLNNLHNFLNELKDIGFGEIKPDQLLSTLLKSYYKAAQLYNDAYSSHEKEVIHKWRKYNKNLLLQLLYSPLDIIKEEETVEQLDKLSDLLGIDHDYAELENNLICNLNLSKDEVQIVHRIIDNLRFRIQKKAFEIGRKLYSQPIKIYSSVLL